VADVVVAFAPTHRASRLFSDASTRLRSNLPAGRVVHILSHMGLWTTTRRRGPASMRWVRVRTLKLLPCVRTPGERRVAQQQERTSRHSPNKSRISVRYQQPHHAAFRLRRAREGFLENNFKRNEASLVSAWIGTVR